MEMSLLLLEPGILCLFSTSQVMEPLHCSTPYCLYKILTGSCLKIPFLEIYAVVPLDILWSQPAFLGRDLRNRPRLLLTLTLHMFWELVSLQSSKMQSLALFFERFYSQMSMLQMDILKLFSLQYSPFCLYWDIFLLERDRQVLLPSFLKKRKSSGGSFYSPFLPLHSFCELAQRLRTKEEREILGEGIWLIYQKHSPNPQRDSSKVIFSCFSPYLNLIPIPFISFGICNIN